MDNYTEQYKSLKGSRTLQWKPHLGLVELDLELEDRTLSFSVTPARAATIMYFQQKRKFFIIVKTREQLITLYNFVWTGPHNTTDLCKNPGII